jgi:hypothetical protein
VPDRSGNRLVDWHRQLSCTHSRAFPLDRGISKRIERPLKIVQEQGELGCRELAAGIRLSDAVQEGLQRAGGAAPRLKKFEQIRVARGAIFAQKMIENKILEIIRPQVVWPVSAAAGSADEDVAAPKPSPL